MSKVSEFITKPILKIPLLFGLVTGILAFGYFLALYFMGITPLGNKRTLDFGIYLITMSVACWYYRKHIGQGWLHMWEALTLCYVIMMTASFITGWLIYFFVTYADTSILPNYIGEMERLLLNGKADLVKSIKEPEFLKLLAEIKNTRAEDLITDEISKKTIISVIPILVISLIFRKQNNGIFEKN